MENGTNIEIGLLYSEYRDLINSYILRLSRDRDTADDLTQETFVRIQKSFHTFDPARGSFFAWARTIARNIYIRHKSGRAYRESPVAEGMDRMADIRPGAPAQVEQSTITSLVATAVESLPEPERSIIKHKYVESLTLDEIAAKVGISRRTVSRRYLKAMELLKNSMEARGLDSAL